MSTIDVHGPEKLSGHKPLNSHPPSSRVPGRATPLPFTPLLGSTVKASRVWLLERGPQRSEIFWKQTTGSQFSPGFLETLEERPVHIPRRPRLGISPKPEKESCWVGSCQSKSQHAAVAVGSLVNNMSSRNMPPTPTHTLGVCLGAFPHGPWHCVGETPLYLRPRTYGLYKSIQRC